MGPKFRAQVLKSAKRPKIWSKKLPERSGWYWASWIGKWGRTYQPVCFQILNKNGRWIISTDRGTYFDADRKFPEAKFKFGPRIEEPSGAKPCWVDRYDEGTS